MMDLIMAALKVHQLAEALAHDLVASMVVT